MTAVMLPPDFRQLWGETRRKLSNQAGFSVASPVLLRTVCLLFPIQPTSHPTRSFATAPPSVCAPPERTTATLRTLRTALTKTGWSHNEVRMMHGIIAALGRTGKPARGDD